MKNQHNAGIPGMGGGLRWKSKLVTTSSVFDPAIEAPGVTHFRIVWAAGGGSAINIGPGGGQGQIFDTMNVVEITAPLTLTIGAGGTGDGGTGGDTTITGTNLDGTKVAFTALGGQGKNTPAWVSSANFMAGGNPFAVYTGGREGRVNGHGDKLVDTCAVTGGEGTFTFVGRLVGGYVCSPPGATNSANSGCGGWRGKGGAAVNGDPGVGYGSGGGTAGSATGGSGKGGCVEFFWLEQY